MATKLAPLKNRLYCINNQLHRCGSDLQLQKQDFIELEEKQKQFSKAVVDLLKYDPIILNASIPYIDAHLFEEIGKERIKLSKDGIQALISTLNLVIVAASNQKQTYEAMDLGRKLESISHRENTPKEYSVKEFAELTHLHPHTIRKRFKAKELQGRKDSKGIFIAATELERFKTQNNAE